MIDLAWIERLARRAQFRPGTGITAGWEGRRRGAMRGQGLSFAGHREYAYGDDIRHMDWRVTARLARPFVRLFEQQGAGTVLLLLDTSASMRSDDGVRARQTIEVAAFLIILAMQAGERVGAILFTDRIECTIAPRRGRAHALASIARVVEHRPSSSRTAIGRALEAAARLAPPLASIILLSDFLDPDFAGALQRLRRGHDVTALSTACSGPGIAPEAGLLRARDPETGATRWLDPRSARVRAAIDARHRQLAEDRRELFESASVPLLELGDEPSWVATLARVGLGHRRAHG